MRDHKVHVKKQAAAKEKKLKEEMDWIDYGTTRASNHAKRTLRETQTRARQEEKDDLKSRYAMHKKMKSEAARHESELATEKKKHLDAIQKTAVDVAKAADRHAKKQTAKAASKDEEDEEFYFAERRAKELEKQLEDDLKKTPDEKKEEEEEKELEK